MPKHVAEEYSELMHYTNAAGLAGIVYTGCLWATHAACLNDAAEMTHFFDARLGDVVLAEVLKRAGEMARNPTAAARMEAEGGIEMVAKSEAGKLVGRLRSATLSVNQPYIFSMSATHDPKVRHSGLLSQWRGYGGDGGYAIVFDTKEFDRLLSLEAETYHYQHFVWGDVHYYGADASNQPSSDDVGQSEEVIRRGIAKLIHVGPTEEDGDFYQAISSLSCLYKHWGFLEEHEVRVVAIPVDVRVARLAAADGERKRQKLIETFVRGGMPMSYIELFGSGNSASVRARLPIKRVIVGPHRDAVNRAQAVDRLLTSNGYDAKAVLSQIPYIGR